MLRYGCSLLVLGGWWVYMAEGGQEEKGREES